MKGILPFLEDFAPVIYIWICFLIFSWLWDNNISSRVLRIFCIKCFLRLLSLSKECSLILPSGQKAKRFVLAVTFNISKRKFMSLGFWNNTDYSPQFTVTARTRDLQSIQ